MKFISVLVLAFLLALPVFGSGFTSDKDARVVSALALLEKTLPAGTYNGTVDDGDKCTVTVATYKNGKSLNDYDLTLKVFGGAGRKKSVYTSEFNLFNDGRDGSDTWVVEIAQQTDRGAGTTDILRVLHEETDDDADTVELKAPRLAIQTNPKGKLVSIYLNKTQCTLE